MSINIYQLVTDRILEQLEKNIIPWRKPWVGGMPVNYMTQKSYQGINLLLLPYGGEWITYKQCTELDGNVKKREKSSMIIFFKMVEKEDEDNPDQQKVYPCIKYSNVFHISQCEGVTSKLPDSEPSDIDLIERAENVISSYVTRANLDLQTIRGSNRAFYDLVKDSITLPDISQFTNSNDYYSVAFHELAHSTGHKERLNRWTDSKVSFASIDYSKEELVAEIGASMVMNMLDLEIPETFENSIAYIDGWRKKIKSDNKIIVSSANLAQKSANLILDIETK